MSGVNFWLENQTIRSLREVFCGVVECTWIEVCRKPRNLVLLRGLIEIHTLIYWAVFYKFSTQACKNSFNSTNCALILMYSSIKTKPTQKLPLKVLNLTKSPKTSTETFFTSSNLKLVKNAPCQCPEWIFDLKTKQFGPYVKFFVVLLNARELRCVENHAI